MSCGTKRSRKSERRVKADGHPPHSACSGLVGSADILVVVGSSSGPEGMGNVAGALHTIGRVHVKEKRRCHKIIGIFFLGKFPSKAPGRT